MTQNRTLLALLGATLISLCGSLRAEDTVTADHIANSRVFHEPLLWIGKTPPGEAECAALWEALLGVRAAGAVEGIELVENHLRDHPASGWAPSLHANLGVYHRAKGRYTRALEHWEAAWEATRSAQEGPARQIADYTVSHWTQLLSSLGRLETLEAIFRECQGRKLTNAGWHKQFIATREALTFMRNNPGDSYKCGTLALLSVVDSTKQAASPAALKKLRATPSPRSGFSMAQLMELSTECHLELSAVRRTAGEELVVPSVVHWKQNHFAAIVERKGLLYRVNDSTFGRSRWLHADVINEEASGNFLVPSTGVPHGWILLSDDQAEGIRGKGINSHNGRPRGPVCGEEDEGCCMEPGGGPQGGFYGPRKPGDVPGAGGCATGLCGGGQIGGSGMPVWRVDEPYISVWLHDQPMSYPTSIGKDMELRLTYHQRETRPDDTSVFNFGPDWNCNWLSYIDVEPEGGSFTNYTATVYTATGGQRIYTETSGLDYQSRTSLQLFRNTPTDIDKIVITYPTGSEWTYGLVLANGAEDQRVFLTSKSDLRGFTTTFHYSTNGNLVLLTHVVDVDGLTNTISYNSTNLTQIVAIQNPHQATVSFGYRPDRRLTNITDVVSIPTHLTYAETNGLDVISKLITPYGTTSFEHLNAAGNLYGENSGSDDINRAVRVTEADGGKHVFMYRDSSRWIVRNSQTIYFLPLSYPSAEVPDIDEPVNSLEGLANVYMAFRNSFRWGPRQYEELSTTNLTNLSTNDYLRAHLSNWLHEDLLVAVTSVGQTLNMERAPSSDGTMAGQRTWYGYHGKEFGPFDDGMVAQGTNAAPSYVAQLLPNGASRYSYTEYNRLNNPTLAASTFGSPASVQLRTNTMTYRSSNDRDVIAVFDANGDRDASYDFYKGMVTVFTNALGEVTTNTYVNERLAATSRPSGLTTTNIYNAAGWLERTIELEIQRTNSFTYSAGRVATMTDARGLITTNLWDNLGRLLSSHTSEGSISNRYTALDLSATRDQLGNWTYFAYDSARRLTAITNAAGHITSYSYCACGSLESMTDGEGDTTTYYYDDIGRRIATVYPDGSAVTNHYNLIGQVTNTIDSLGNSITNYFTVQGLLGTSSNSMGEIYWASRDILDRELEILPISGINVHQDFDDLGRTVHRSDASGANYYGYSSRGMIAHTNGVDEITRYAYDAAGRKLAETNGIGVVTQYEYNPAGDLTKLVRPGDDVTFYYDPFGRLTNRTDGSTVTLTYGYDANGRLTSRWSAGKGTTSYGYDAVGNLISVDYPVSPDISYAYDADNRLTNRVDATGTSRYSYTALGQPESVDGPWDNDTVSYSYNHGLRTGLLLQRPNGSAWDQSYSYDQGGRLTNILSAADDHDTHSGKWLGAA